MKKIIVAIALMLFSYVAAAQVKEVRDSHGIPSYEFTLGKFVFRGGSDHGCYLLSYTTSDHDEAEMLYYFLHENKEEIARKFGADIKTIEIFDTVKDYYYSPVTKNLYTRKDGSTAVRILIETPDHEKYLQAVKAEKEEKLKSLQNIF